MAEGKEYSWKDKLFDEAWDILRSLGLAGIIVGSGGGFLVLFSYFGQVLAKLLGIALGGS